MHRIDLSNIFLSVLNIFIKKSLEHINSDDEMSCILFLARLLIQKTFNASTHWLFYQEFQLWAF